MADTATVEQEHLEAQAETPAVGPGRPHPYADFLHQVARPARYTGGEFQSVRKDWDAVELRYAMAFPDVYDIGMSHLGTKILYDLVRRLPWALGERVFAPWLDLEAELRARDLPLVSLESWRPLRDFDVVGFSLQYELTWTNLLNMLDLGGVPLRNADRGETDPLIIAGGPNATHPEVLAPFVDAFVIGDGEEALPELLEVVRGARKDGLDRRATLRALAQLPGVFCPDLYHRAVVDDAGFCVVTGPIAEGVPPKVQRRVVADLSAFPFPDDAPVAAAEAIFDRMSIEIARGCTEGCRFCQAGIIYRPVRERSPEEVVDTVMRAVENAGYDEVSLTTLSTADYSCISPLVGALSETLKQRQTSLSVASLRAYGLADTLFDDLSAIRANSLTFAPEAGSQRMRDVINKNISEADLHTTARRVFSRRWRKVKCYFMIGLPTEEDEDILAIADTAAGMRAIGREYQRDADVTVSVSSHVPKPHTPFQWAAMDTMEEIGRKQALLRDACWQVRLKLRKHNPRTSFLECVLGRGDRAVSEALELAWRRGARFDGWDDQLQFELWEDALRDAGVQTERYTGRLPEDAALPWDHIDVGLEPGFLAQEHKRSMKGRLSPPCGKPKGMQVHHTNLAEADADRRKLVCYHCGVACDLDEMRQQRKDFLQTLGALQPAAPRSAAAPIAAPTPVRRPGKGAPTPRPSRAPYRGPVHRYRVRYTRQGAEAMTSHLDMVRSLPRVLRRAGMPLRYTDGFHPKPRMTFAPALPLGTASRGELLDIDLTENLDPIDVLRRLQRAQTEGMRFLSVERVGPGVPGLADAIGSALYAVSLRRRSDDGLPGADGSEDVDLDRALRSFLASGSWLVRTSRQGVDRLLDARQQVRRLERRPDGRLLLEVAVTSHGATARPREVIDAVLGHLDRYAPIEPHDVERLALLPHVAAPVATDPTDALGTGG